MCITYSVLASVMYPLQHMQILFQEMNNSDNGNNIRKQLDYAHDCITTKSLFMLCFAPGVDLFQELI